MILATVVSMVAPGIMGPSWKPICWSIATADSNSDGAVGLILSMNILAMYGFVNRAVKKLSHEG